MAKDYSLFSGQVGGKGGGKTGVDKLQSILAMVLKMEGGETGAQKQMPPPSAAPVGQATATGGVSRGMPSMAQPPLAQALGKGQVTSPITGRTMATDKAQMPTQQPQVKAPTTAPSGGMMDLIGGGATGAGKLGDAVSKVGDVASTIGDYGGAIAGIGSAAVDIYDAFSMDEREGAMRADRHLKEQQLEHRQNFMDVYDKYFMPMQVGSQMYAYQKMGQHSDQYEYTSQLLKGYLEGSKGVWGGQSQWNNVWGAIGDPDVEPPEDFLGKLQYNYENGIVDPGQIALTNWMIGELLPGVPEGITTWMSMELGKWGNAFMKSIGG